MKLLCIDGHSVLNRAFYGVKLLTTKDGRFTNAIYGFLSILLKLTDQVKPDAVAIAFDVREKTFRHDRYAQYKGTRKPSPPELSEQVEPLKELLGALGYTIVTAPGYEADDILGTFAHRCESSDDDFCSIATGDRDALQLVGERVHVLLTTTKHGAGETTEMDIAAVQERYGIAPRQLIEVKALMGDSSDNIPGVAGVGEKTALALIQQFESLDGVYEHLGDASIRDGLRLKLTTDRDKAYLSRELVTIDCAVPVDVDPAHYVRQQGDSEKAASMLADLEMHSLLQRLNLKAEAAAPRPAAAALPACEPVPLTASALADLKRCCVLRTGDGCYAASGTAVWTVDEPMLWALLAAPVEKLCTDAKSWWHLALDNGSAVQNLNFDAKIAAYLLNPSASAYSVASLAAEYRVKPLFSGGPEELGSLEPLCAALRQQLEEQGMTALFRDIEMPLVEVLARMEQEGFLLDTGGLGQFGGELNGHMAAEQAAVYELVGKEFNLNSPKQLGEALFETLGLPAGKKTKTGYSTNAETLEKLRGAHPVIDHILRYRTYQKLSATYVEGLLRAVDASGRVHTDFNQTETRTGRISSREPNLQNIPVRTELGSRFRGFFIAKPGFVLLDADYSQIELRVLASISGDTRMIAAFSSGRDIHTETASEIFKVDRDAVTPELRRRAKAVNFGIVYGIGAYSLAEDVGVSMKEAASYIEGYLATYSGVAAYLDATVQNAKRDGYVTTLYGRRRALPELASSNKMLEAFGKRLAMNTPIQGTAADIIKIAMIRVSRRLLAEQLEARLILQVHDELIIESSQKDAARAADVLKEEMMRAAEMAVPLEVDVGQGESWLAAK